MQIKLPNLKLQMVEGLQMPEQVYDKTSKTWTKTNKQLDYYKYNFITNDDFREKLVFTKEKAKGDFSLLENKLVDVYVTLKQSDFQGKLQNRFSLDTVTESKSK